jgi:hypothetical protein
MSGTTKDNYEREKKKSEEDIKNTLEEKTVEDLVMIPIVLTNNPRAKKMTIAKQREFLQAVIEEWNVAKAAHKIGVSRSTIYDLIEKSEGFRKAFEEIRDSHLDDIECNLINEGKGRNFTPGIFMLKQWRPERYGPKIEIDTGPTITLENAGAELRRLLAGIPTIDSDKTDDADFKEIQEK